MLVLFCLAMLLVVCGCRLRTGAVERDYISIDQTRVINGIFMVLILLSHTFACTSAEGLMDENYVAVRTFLGQFVVVPIMFYSGYGIALSLTKDGYLKSFPRNRLLKLVKRFGCITLVYVWLHLIMGTGYSFVYVVLSFVGITSIKNGGWYILSTLMFYISVIICFNIFKNNMWIAIVATSFCMVGCTVLEMVVGFPVYYYNTMIFFAAGMYYFMLKDQFERLVLKNGLVWSVLLLTGVVGFVVLKKMINWSVLFYPVWCASGMLIVLCFTMKVKIQSKIFGWFGEKAFFIFTLQGIPQLLLPKVIGNKYVLYICVLLGTVTLAGSAERLFDVIVKRTYTLNK